MLGAGVRRAFAVNCAGDSSLNGLLLRSDGTVEVPDATAFTFTSPDAVFGALASLSSAAWNQVGGEWGSDFIPAGCFGPGDPLSDTSIENLSAFALAADGTLASVSGVLCSGDCVLSLGIPLGFSGHPWVFEGDLIP